MSAMSIRDKWLAAALPAMVTLLLGWLIFLRPAQRETATLRQRVINQGPISARQALVTRAQAERADLEQTLAERRTAPREEDGVFDRNWAMQQVSLLCATHGLSLNATALESGAKLPPALQEATAALQRGGGTSPQVWRIEVSGAYASVVRLLVGLQKTQPLIVPLNLSMKAGRTERQPALWTLSLWL
jgi:hypothetical protein